MQQEKVLKDLLTRIINFNEQVAFDLCEQRKTILVKIAPLTKYEDNPENIRDLTIE